MSDVKVSDSYVQNQCHLRGQSTNLSDTNMIISHIAQCRKDREDKSKLMSDIMNKVYEMLGIISISHKRTRLPDDEIVIRDCQNVIYGVSVSEMRRILADLNLPLPSEDIKIRTIVQRLNNVMDYL